MWCDVGVCWDMHASWLLCWKFFFLLLGHTKSEARSTVFSRSFRQRHGFCLRSEPYGHVWLGRSVTVGRSWRTWSVVCSPLLHGHSSLCEILSRWWLSSLQSQVLNSLGPFVAFFVWKNEAIQLSPKTCIHLTISPCRVTVNSANSCNNVSCISIYPCISITGLPTGPSWQHCRHWAKRCAGGPYSAIHRCETSTLTILESWGS